MFPKKMPVGAGGVMLRSRLTFSAANRILPTKHLEGIFILRGAGASRHGEF
jgi:hypothetical protein